MSGEKSMGRLNTDLNFRFLIRQSFAIFATFALHSSNALSSSAVTSSPAFSDCWTKEACVTGGTFVGSLNMLNRGMLSLECGV